MMNIYIRRNCSVYEIYPQSDTTHLIKIAHLDFFSAKDSHAHLKLLPGTAIWHYSYKDRIVFKVWEYRLNHSVCFSVDIDNERYKSAVSILFHSFQSAETNF